MYSSIILPSAKEEIRKAAKWYNSQQSELGREFSSEAKKVIVFIRQNPFATQVRYSNVRTTVMNKFPFMIHYITDETKSLIIILAVLHTSRNPKLWKRNQ